MHITIKRLNRVPGSTSHGAAPIKSLILFLFLNNFFRQASETGNELKKSGFCLAILLTQTR